MPKDAHRWWVEVEHFGSEVPEPSFGEQACQLVGGGAGCGGSINSNYFEVLGGPAAGNIYSVFGDTLVDHPAVSGVDPGINPPTFFNSNPYMNLKHGRERYQGGVFAKYEWSEKATLYTDFMFMKDQAQTAVAPSGIFIGSAIPVFCNNSLLSAQQAAALGCTAQMIANGDVVNMLIGRRNIEGGPRFFEYDHTNYRAMAGVRGDLNDAWSYDAYGSYYDTDLSNGNFGYISKTRTLLGLNGCQQSADPTDLAAGCVPYNIWRDGGVTTAAMTKATTMK